MTRIKVLLSTLILLTLGIVFLASLFLKTRTGEVEPFVPGEIVVGFKKGVTEEEAESLLTSFSLKFVRTDDINAGKLFFYNTGAKYLIYVKPGEEQEWINKLSKNSLIYGVERHNDSRELIID